MHISRLSATCSKSIARVAAKRLEARRKGARLEKRVALLFSRLGYLNVRRNVRVKDSYGNWSEVDVVAGAIPFFRVHVECKAHSAHRPVQLQQVAKFREVLRLLGIPLYRGLVVGTSRFSPRCASVGIRLWDEDALAEWERRADTLQAVLRVPRLALLLLLLTVGLAEAGELLAGVAEDQVMKLGDGREWQEAALSAVRRVREGAAWARGAWRGVAWEGVGAIPGGHKAVEMAQEAWEQVVRRADAVLGPGEGGEEGRGEWARWAWRATGRVRGAVGDVVGGFKGIDGQQGPADGQGAGLSDAARGRGSDGAMGRAGQQLGEEDGGTGGRK